MKIAVTSSGTQLNSPVDPRFGRAPYFLIVDSETMELQAEKNPNLGASSGAGIQSAQMIAEKKAEVLLTGSCGPNAFQTLRAAGVNVVTNVSGTVEDAVKSFSSGRYQPSQQPNVPSHFGMGQGPGMGGGRGGGMSRGMGMGGGRGSVFPPPPEMSSKDEIEILKQQAEQLRRQLDEVTKRIEELK
ncbi:MAG: NifB/NifX family molybdenum-iron cluster-binding protein [Candidatus Aminicenantes bacterium]